MPRTVRRNSRIRIFPYKILDNVLYLNKSYSSLTKEALQNVVFANVKKRRLFICFIFVEKVKFWTQLTSRLNRYLDLPHLTPQSAIFDFLDIPNKDYLIVNNLLLLFKYYIYNARDQNHLLFKVLMKNIKNIYDIKKNLADQDSHKKTKFLKKRQYV